MKEIDWDAVRSEFEVDLEFADAVVTKYFGTEAQIVDQAELPDEPNAREKRAEALASRRAALQVVLRAVLEISMKERLGLDI